MPPKSNPPGPTGQRVAANVAWFRADHGMAKAELSRRLAMLGRPMSLDVITKVEAGQRPLDTDDLVAVALVLKVSPTALLLHDPVNAGLTEEDADGVMIQLTPAAAVPILDAAEWMWEGAGPLGRPKAPPLSLAEVMSAHMERDDDGR